MAGSNEKKRFYLRQPRRENPSATSKAFVTNNLIISYPSQAIEGIFPFTIHGDEEENTTFTAEIIAGSSWLTYRSVTYNENLQQYFLNFATDRNNANRIRVGRIQLTIVGTTERAHFVIDQRAERP